MPLALAFFVAILVHPIERSLAAHLPAKLEWLSVACATIIAGIPPILLAFVQFGPGKALLVAGGLLAMEQVIGNFVDPRLQGRTLNVSSLVVLLSVILWGWIWGVPGALIAVPLTVTIILACSKVAMLRPIAVQLSGGEDNRESNTRD